MLERDPVVHALSSLLFGSPDGWRGHRWFKPAYWAVSVLLFVGVLIVASSDLEDASEDVQGVFVIGFYVAQLGRAAVEHPGVTAAIVLPILGVAFLQWRRTARQVALFGAPPAEPPPVMGEVDHEVAHDAEAVLEEPDPMLPETPRGRYFLAGVAGVVVGLGFLYAAWTTWARDQARRAPVTSTLASVATLAPGTFVSLGPVMMWPGDDCLRAVTSTSAKSPREGRLILVRDCRHRGTMEHVVTGWEGFVVPSSSLPIADLEAISSKYGRAEDLVLLEREKKSDVFWPRLLLGLVALAAGVAFTRSGLRTAPA